ncbi:pilus assembly protein CpaE [Marinobacter pelagius]|uniref:Pilus assembly protein CpaE n=1 Tax=Marinobacter pelagius TaxID=379482 RepID=A0A366GFC6_9GAMM|nr:response regulator receiver-like protein [Marinobacter pelagius]RBP25056.1 pilus assembly protein CpaE [Marinobacter pelagius]
MSGTLVCVSDDVGVRVWIERVLGADWTLEFVTGSDLSRVSRLVRATNAPLVLVAVDEDQPDRAVKILSAIGQACAEVNLVAVAKRVTQESLLSVMRAGARDCLLTGGEVERVKERVRQLTRFTNAPQDQAAGGRGRNIILVTSFSPLVDTRFLSQNLVAEMANRLAGKRILAIDAMASDGQTFYLDNLNRLSLEELIKRQDSVDQSYLDTALDEYTSGLRLLSGNIASSQFEGDAGADLFITVSRLASLFDHVFIRVDESQTENWLRTMGGSISNLWLAMHQTVDQAKRGSSLVPRLGDWISEQCDVALIVEGYERRVDPHIEEIEKVVGLPCRLTLPIEWKQRLVSINSGLSLNLLPSSSRYHRKLSRFVKEQFSARPEAREGSKGHLRKKLFGNGEAEA